MLTRAGFDLTGATAEASDGTTAWNVTFTPIIDGLAVVGSPWSMTIGAQGRILSASGGLADPVAVGDYPLVGVSTGLERLREGWKWIIYRGPVTMMAAGAPAPTASVPPSTAPSRPPATPACGNGQPCLPTSGPAPTTPPTTAPRVIVTVTGVHLALAWAWPLESTAEAWLVPVYLFEITGGHAYPFLGDGVPVLAVADRYIATTPTTPPPMAATVSSGP